MPCLVDGDSGCGVRGVGEGRRRGGGGVISGWADDIHVRCVIVFRHRESFFADLRKPNLRDLGPKCPLPPQNTFFTATDCTTKTGIVRPRHSK